VPLPDLEDDHVLVRVRACGICGSDVHGYDGSTGRRIPPLVMGHEAAGEVERTGRSVHGFDRGDRVTFDSTVWCGACEYCIRGTVNLCSNRRVLGVSCADYRRHGAFAEFVSVPARIVHRLPPGMPFEHAALIEAVAVAVHAVRRAAPRPDQAIAVIGCGMIGLLVAQGLRQRGCSRIIAIEIDEHRRALAARFGAPATINPGSTSVSEEVRRLTDSRGADHVFEVVGHAATVRDAVACARRGGTVTLVGNLAPTVDLPLQAVITSELTLLGSCASSGEYPDAIDLVARGEIDVAPLISAVAPLAEGAAWFSRLHGANSGLIKVILRP
jgi:L-iditol 2-dehydrogenase